MKRRAALTTMLIAILSVTSIANAQATRVRTASGAELRQMHDAGQYRICLQQIARILRLANAEKTYDRYDLLLLRGDCLLHLEDPATAKFAYAAAAKSPVAEQAREARATLLLLQRSSKMTYVPRGRRDSGDPVDLKSKEGRIEALRALLEDELSAGESDFRRAIHAENLAPIQDVLPRLADLYAVERIATGKDSNVRPFLEAIGQRARRLVDRELGLSEQSVTAVESRANQRVDAPIASSNWWSDGYTRRGLYSKDRQALRDLSEYLDRIEEEARLGRQLAASFDSDATEWDSFVARASKAARHARDVLDGE